MRIVGGRAKKRSRVRGGLRLLQTSHQGRRSGANAARSVAGATARSRRAHSSFAHRGTAPFVRNSLIHVSNSSRIEEDGGRQGPRAAARSSPRLPHFLPRASTGPGGSPRRHTSPARAWRGLSGRLARGGRPVLSLFKVRAPPALLPRPGSTSRPTRAPPRARRRRPRRRPRSTPCPTCSPGARGPRPRRGAPGSRR